jgi:Flp pilus assembly protein CpaB
MRFSRPVVAIVTADAILTAAVVVVALLLLDARGSPDTASEPMFPTVVAAQPIPAGTVITAEMVNVAVVSEPAVAAFDDTSSVVGQVAVITIAPGEQITPAKISSVWRPGPPPGPRNLRAIAISTEPVTTEGQTLLPGARIDITVDREGGAATVLEDIEVLAVQTVETPNSSSITVAVLPEQALRLATTMETLDKDGTIRLSLSR